MASAYARTEALGNSLLMWKIECVVFSMALGHSGDFCKKK